MTSGIILKDTLYMSEIILAVCSWTAGGTGSRNLDWGEHANSTQTDWRGIQAPALEVQQWNPLSHNATFLLARVCFCLNPQLSNKSDLAESLHVLLASHRSPLKVQRLAVS